jgi:diaminopimelate epimerase
LRIFGCYLYNTRRTRRRSFSVATKGGLVHMELHVNKYGEVEGATVEMGQASFRPEALPCRLSVPELVRQPIQVFGRKLIFTGVSVGNPHCVLFRDKGGRWTREELLSLGPAIENHPWFPRRTNVQLAVPTGRNSLSILIWERGAGETQASGSSACAAASAAVRTRLVKSPVTVNAPGGSLRITVNPDFCLTMEGPVEEVARGQLSPTFVRTLR